MGASNRLFEFLEFFITYLVLIAGFVPMSNSFAVEDEDVEEHSRRG